MSTTSNYAWLSPAVDAELEQRQMHLLTRQAELTAELERANAQLAAISTIRGEIMRGQGKAISASATRNGLDHDSDDDDNDDDDSTIDAALADADEYVPGSEHRAMGRKRKRGSPTCGRCGQLGHTRRWCKNEPAKVVPEPTK